MYNIMFQGRGLRKLAVIASLVVFSLTIAAAPEPRHPLSQIHPIDVDLNMSDQNIENVSQLQFNDGIGEKGLLLEGYTITDEGKAQKIVLDYQNDEWDILNSNLNMNGNNITGIDTLHFVSGASINGSLNTSGGNVNLENGSLTDVYSIDGGGDAINFFDTIDMNGNIITDSNGDLEIDGNVYLPTGSLDMAGNNIINPGNVDGVDLDNPGNGLDITNSRYEIIDDAIGDSELNNSQSFTVDGLTSTSNIDISGYNLTSVDTIHFVSGASINGSLNTTGGDVNLDNGSINDVDSIDGGGDPVRFDDDLDLNGNNLIEPNQIQTAGQNIQVRDTTNGQDIARFQEGGNVGIPNGNLDIGSPTNQGEVLDVGGGANFDSSIALNSNDVTELNRLTGDGGQEIYFAGGGNSDVIFSGSGGRVFYLRDQDGIQFDSNSNGAIRTDGTGSGSIDIVDDANSQNIAEFNEGGNVDIPNGNLKTAGILQLGGGENINKDDLTGSAVPRIYRNTGPSYSNGDLVVEPRTDQDRAIHFVTGTARTEALNIYSNGAVDIPNGNLDLQGNRLVDTTSSNTVNVGDGSDDAVVLDAPNNVQVQSGNLDMNSNNISNFFENYCESGEAVAGVDDDGGYYCVNIGEEVMDIFVNESGDSMTGDLDMRGNDIYDVGSQGIGTDTPQENLDVDGTASVENSGTRMEVDSSGNVVVSLGS